MKKFRLFTVYSLVNAVHKRMYGTVTKLAILEVIRLMGEHFCEELINGNEIDIDNFIKVKIVKVNKWGLVKKKIKVSLYKNYSDLMLKVPLNISDEELTHLNNKRRKKMESFVDWVRRQAENKDVARAKWISARTKRKSLAYPVDS